MTPKIRVGFIGAGRISDLHQLGYRDNPTGELAAVADVDANVAESQAKKWGVRKVYTDHRKLLADKEIDAVEILLPHHLHLPVMQEALAAGKHVSLQKPMALSMDEARQMVAAAKRSGKMFRVLENYRTYEPYMRAKAMLDAGEIGDPMSIRIKTVQGKGVGGWEGPARANVWRAGNPGLRLPRDLDSAVLPGQGREGACDGGRFGRAGQVAGHALDDHVEAREGGEVRLMGPAELA